MTKDSAGGIPAPGFLRRYLAGLLYLGAIILVGYLSYLFGWYTGLVHETVSANIDNGRIMLQASRALRRGEAENALWIQDLAIEGSLYSLERLSNMVPARFEPAHRSLLQDIKDYRAQYPDSNKGTGIEEFEVEK